MNSVDEKSTQPVCGLRRFVVDRERSGGIILLQRRLHASFLPAGHTELPCFIDIAALGLVSRRQPYKIDASGSARGNTRQTNRLQEYMSGVSYLPST